MYFISTHYLSIVSNNIIIKDEEGENHLTTEVEEAVFTAKCASFMQVLAHAHSADEGKPEACHYIQQ